LSVLLVGQTIALVATSRLESLGAEGWHHIASLVVALAIAVVWRKPMTRSRRFLAMGVTAMTLLATVTGFWLLYWKEGIRVAGYQDWGVFWHVAWSWLAAIFFFQHTWINRIALGHFFRRSFSNGPARALHAGVYGVVVVVFLVTWSDAGKQWFTVENYIPLSLYAWLIATVPPYTVWASMAVRASRVAGTATEAWQRLRTAWRGVVDVALVPLAALAVLTGIPLTFWDPFMDANGWKYVSKYWHVWPSVLFTVLVFAHSVQLWRPLKAHWRSLGSNVQGVEFRRREPLHPIE
jgi:hypothetical protein